MEGSLLRTPMPHGRAVLREVLRQRDDYTATHCCRVGMLALALAQLYALEQSMLALLLLAARLHDIGKIGIPDAILQKPGRLDPGEWAIMQTHSERGERIIRVDADFPGQEEVALAIRHHHEHFDGGGYPDGLGGEDIPVTSRILALADSYDAMTRSRVYHKARSHEDVVAILETERGTKFEPQIVDLLLAQDRAWFRQFDLPQHAA